MRSARRPKTAGNYIYLGNEDDFGCGYFCAKTSTTAVIPTSKS